MSISYHGVIGHTSKATLPSVESWGTNMNMLRDPPRSIQTRRNDKVGDKSDITQMIQDSGDRACETIKVYARGVNPMVAVSYDNYGANGGNSSMRSALRTGNAYLPYRVMRNGAFRPPIRPQEDLLPLSRQPRIWTSAYTQPGFANFAKKTMDYNEETKIRSVRDQILKPDIQSIPTTSYQVSTGIVEGFELNKGIQDKILPVYADTGFSSAKRVNAENGEHRFVTPLHADAQMNLGGKHLTKQSDLSHFNTEFYTHDLLNPSADTNQSGKYRNNSVETELQTDRYINSDGIQLAYHTSQKRTPIDMGHISDGSIERNIREIQQYETQTNIRKNTHRTAVDPFVASRDVKRLDVEVNTGYARRLKGSDQQYVNRDYALRPTINSGGYTPNIGLPMLEKENQLIEFDEKKSTMRNKIFDMQMNRH